MRVRFNFVNEADFYNHISELKKASGRSVEEMLKYTMIQMLRAGRAATPLGRKNRSLVTQDAEVETAADLGLKADYGKETRTEKVRFFRVYKQGSHIPKKIFVPRIPRKTKQNESERNSAIQARNDIVSRFKEIESRGVARASWGWAMWLVSDIRGRSVQTRRGERFYESKESKAVSQNTIAMTKLFNTAIPFIEVTNKLGWIRKIAPNLDQRMISSADAKLRKELEGIFKTHMERAGRLPT
jgi:hypothetical protein